MKLFGKRGFSSVRTADLTKTVGCVTSALYKHYKSKQELYDAIIAESTRGFDAGTQHMKVYFNKHPEQKKKYIAVTEEEQIRNAKNLLSYTLHNEWTAVFRKLMKVAKLEI